MNNIKVKFVMVSKNETFAWMPHVTAQFEIAHSNTQFCHVLNNARPLGEVYNAHIMRIRTNNEDYDWLVLMHSDVVFDMAHFLTHLDEVTGKYDAVGLCGCAKCTMSASPLDWFTASNLFPEHRWGYVNHGELNGMPSFWNQHSPNVTDHPVALIDGLCICLSKSLIQSTNLLFDTQFAFNFYDTDFCLQLNTAKRRIGVIVEKSLQHYSIGKGILDASFLQTEITFREKWKLDIPDTLNQKIMSHGR